MPDAIFYLYVLNYFLYLVGLTLGQQFLYNVSAFSTFTLENAVEVYTSVVSHLSLLEL